MSHNVRVSVGQGVLTDVQLAIQVACIYRLFPHTYKGCPSIETNNYHMAAL